MNNSIADQVRAQIEKREKDRAKLQAEVARIDGHIKGLREALSLLQGPVSPASDKQLPPRGSRVPNPKRSRGWAFVLNALKNAPESGLSVAQLMEGAKTKHIKIERNTLRSWLSHAYREKILRRMSTGYYRLASPESQGNAITPEGNGHASPDESETPGDGLSPGASIESGSLPLNQ